MIPMVDDHEKQQINLRDIPHDQKILNIASSAIMILDNMCLCLEQMDK